MRITCQCGSVADVDIDVRRIDTVIVCPQCKGLLVDTKNSTQVTDKRPTRVLDECHLLRLDERKYAEPAVDTPPRRHDGKPIDPNDDFFAEPPPEIGRVLSMETTMKKNHRPRSFRVRLIVALSIWLVLGVCSFLLHGVTEDFLTRIVFVYVIPGGIALVLPTWILLDRTFNHICSYVGTKGLAVIECSGYRDGKTKSSMLIFDDARVLYAKVYIMNGWIYCDLSWKDEADVVLFTILGAKSKHGSYQLEFNNEAKIHYLNLGLAAEKAWTRHQIFNMEKTRDENGYWQFFVGPNRGAQVLVGDHAIKTLAGGQTTTIAKEQIIGVELIQGWIYVKLPGFKNGLFGMTDCEKFNSFDVGNARFFVCLLNRILEHSRSKLNKEG